MNLFNYATVNVITVSPACSIDHAISLMEERDVHHLVVVSAGRVAGMISDRDILISTGWMLSAERQVGSLDSSEPSISGPLTVQEIMSKPACCIPVNETASRAASTMAYRKISALPILDNGRLVGILTDSDLLTWLEALGALQMGVGRFLSQPLDSLMQKKVITVNPDTLLTEVTDVFRRHRIRHVPVMDQGLLAGIISDRDVRRSIGWAEAHESQSEASAVAVKSLSTARDVMQTEVHWATKASSLGDGLRLMLTKHVHSLPVLEAGKLAGILTHTDFIKAIAQNELL
jgi:acetoin utilization protein AcuB